MATCQEHYANVLADAYAWMMGGFDAALARNAAFFSGHDIRPRGNGRAVDLGAGCGFQSIPLAQCGFTVTAIDSDATLLDQLRARAGGLPITVVHDDLLRAAEHVADPVELVVCMTDTIISLPSPAAVQEACAGAARLLAPGGQFIVTFRELTAELTELDRFIPLRSDDTMIMTCFLEYEPATVKVHDLVYRKENGAWRLHKSWYRKLRLTREWLTAALRDAGFAAVTTATAQGMLVVNATR